MIGCLAMLAACACAGADEDRPLPPARSRAQIPYPDWLFPVDDETLRAAKRPLEDPEPPKYDDVELLTIPDSDQKVHAGPHQRSVQRAGLASRRPRPMPDIVAKGRKPKVIACAYCHTPTGQGRPENSALAGLPEAYIKEQLDDFRAATRAHRPEKYRPAAACRPWRRR
jgi:cytochrome c553